MLHNLICLIFISAISLANFGKSGGQGPETGSSPSVDFDALSVERVTLSNEGTISPGDTIELKLKLELIPGYHAYLDQFKLMLEEPKDYHLSDHQILPQVQFTDPITKKTKLGIKEYGELMSLIDVPHNARPGLEKLKFNLTYQACSKDFCLFPKTITVEKKIVIGSATDSSDPLTEALEKGWLYALFIVFMAGLLTSFTPCIFPMIPITLAILGTADHQRSRRARFTVSVSYVLGIALTYSILGLVAARTGALFGSLLGHPLVVGLISVLFIIMGLSMYGFFDIQLPHFITRRLSGHNFNKNIIGAFASGLVAGVVASPCVGPVLISILAYVAQTQSDIKGFILLFTFAVGLGQIFILLGTFNSILHKLPRSGPWMEKVKFLFGTVMIGMALYYVYPVSHNNLLTGLLATLLLVISIYFGALRPRRQLHTRLDRFQKAAMLVLFVLGLILSAKSLTPKHMYEKLLAPASVAETSGVHVQWANYSDELLQKAMQEKRPVIIDFKADWCLACKELEKYTFSDPRVVELGKKFLWLAFDATSSSPELEVLQQKYNIGGLPFIVIYNDQGEHAEDLTLKGFENADLFLKRMQGAIKN